MNRWLELTRTALLGTQRAPLPDLADESPLGQLMGTMAAAPPEQTLLQMVGTLDLYEQVGRQPQHFVQPPVATSDLSTQRECSTALTQRLAGMLDGRHSDLLNECLQAMNRANLQIPAVLLPDLLQRGQKSALLRPYLLPVLGENGRWLAAQNPAWAYAAPAADTWEGVSAKWRTVEPSERLALLRQLRDLNPALGLTMVTASWKSEAAPTRLAMIRHLQTGLSMADEPFLEMALDDRQASVRQKAADLLAHLPESRLCQRMAANAQQLLSYNPARAYQIVPTFPIPLSDEMVRDGVSRLPENATGNVLARARSRQLTQIIGAVPLDYWVETWQASPETIVRAFQASRWPRTLTQAFAIAAQRQRNVAWALSLAKHADFTAVAPKIIPVLTPEIGKQLVQQIGETLDDKQPLLHKTSPLLRILRYWSHNWDAEMIAVWTKYLVQQIQADEKPSPLLRTAVKQFARACQPDEADEVITTAVSPLIETHTGWKTALNELVRILRFRREMYEEMKI